MECIEELHGQSVVCALLARALLREADKAWLDTLVRERVFEELPFAAGQPDARAGIALLADWSAIHAGGTADDVVSTLRNDYNRLFVGPAKLLAAPWESVYMDRERVLFQPVTLAVRNSYERFGVARAGEFNEPEDHVGLELSFIAHLASLALAAHRRGDAETFETLVKARDEFVHNHPRRWVPNWQRDVEKHADTDFYRGVARLARGVVKALENAARRS